MKTIGNILWILFGGLLGAIAWVIIGLLWCVTLIGIPVGKQCFKFASLTLCPFGKDIQYGNTKTVGTLANIIWLLLFGIEMACTFCVIGAVFCITIIGIPFGRQYFKLARLSIMPFGAEIVG